jgi:phage terminase large subunit-like protein
MSQTRADKIKYLSLLKEKDRRKSQNKISTFYPEEGKLSRHNYPKHMEFFAAGKNYSERCMMAANRVGKTEGVGGYELTMHLTGDYPDWWDGLRYDRPIKSWAAGTTSTTTRDILQNKLIGPKEDIGTGLIPGDKIAKTTPKAGVPDAVDTVLVKHSSGGVSRLKFKAYKEGRKSFEGTEQDIILLDEECPLNIYLECLIRTMTTNGHILFTFTPLEGLTETVLQFMPGGKIQEKESGTKKVIMATWDDAPHLTQEQRDKLYESLPVYQRDARTKGIPQLGSGAIYPITESDIIVPPFRIPEHWPKSYGLDVGWNKTAAIFGAIDRENDCAYLYHEHYMGKAEPVIHAKAIQAPGEWIPGTIDPASRGRGQRDGEQLLQDYIDLGLDLTMAKNAVESGIHKVWMRLSTGRMKVFSSCQNWLGEFRIYRRDENGNIVKEKDHLMDGTRYYTFTGIDIAIVKPGDQIKNNMPGSSSSVGGWAR